MRACRLSSLHDMERFASPWLKAPARRDAAPDARLVCFPHAGAGASSFARWMREAPAALEIWRVQLPGREDASNQPVPNDLREVVPPLAQALSVMATKKLPLLLYGHSLGAALANLVAGQLEDGGSVNLKGLLVSGRRAPQLASRSLDLHDLRGDELATELARAGGLADLPDRVSWRKSVVTLVGRDLAALACIPPQPPGSLKIPIVAFHGQFDPWVTENDSAAWQFATRSCFTLRRYRGGHFDHHVVRHSIMAEALRLAGTTRRAVGW